MAKAVTEELSYKWLVNNGFNYQPPGISGADMWQDIGFWRRKEIVLRGVKKPCKDSPLMFDGYFKSSIVYVAELKTLYRLLTGEKL